MSRKIVPGVLKFERILLQRLGTGYERKALLQVFSDCPVCFFKYLKNGMSKKFVTSIFRFVRMLFQISEKGYEQKNYRKYI